MHRIDGPGNVGGQFSAGMPGITEATNVTADWMNAVQEELVNVIQSAEITLSKADNAQLRTALGATYGKLAGENVWLEDQVFESSLSIQGGIAVTGAATVGSLASIGGVSAESLSVFPGATSLQDVTAGAATLNSVSVGAGGSTFATQVDAVSFVPSSNPATTTDIRNELTAANMTKAWVTFETNAAGPIVRDGVHIASVENLTANVVRVTFASAFANAYYAWTAGCDNSGYEPRVSQRTTTTADISAKNDSGAPVPIGSGTVTPVEIVLTFTGRQ